MEPLDRYIALANSLLIETFIAAHPYGFLLKRPQQASGRGAIEFRTEYLVRGPVRPRDSDVTTDEWGITPVAKRPNNPFPERLTVGRSPNCDIVIRVSFVSKVHAHLLIAGRVLQVRDAGSANGTKLEGKSIGAEPVPIRDGDRLSLAELDLELVAAPRAHALLRSLSAVKAAGRSSDGSEP